MKYCSECGKEVHFRNKFCPECGIELNKVENKIDKSVDKVKSGISSIQKELSESKTVVNITEGAKKIANETSKKAKSTVNKFLQILGIIGIVVIGLMILHPIITGKDFVVQSAFEGNFNGNYKNYAGFIGEITAPIILPLIFIYLGFKKNNDVKGCLLLPLTIGLIIFIIVLITK
jgi:hypothetical protein